MKRDSQYYIYRNIIYIGSYICPHCRPAPWWISIGRPPPAPPRGSSGPLERAADRQRRRRTPRCLICSERRRAAASGGERWRGDQGDHRYLHQIQNRGTDVHFCNCHRTLRCVNWILINPYALTLRRKHVAQARSSVRRLRGRLHLMRFVSRVGGPPGTMPASSERPLRDQTRPASELP